MIRFVFKIWTEKAECDKKLYKLNNADKTIEDEPLGSFFHLN